MLNFLLFGVVLFVFTVLFYGLMDAIVKNVESEKARIVIKKSSRLSGPLLTISLVAAFIVTAISVFALQSEIVKDKENYLEIAKEYDIDQQEALYFEAAEFHALYGSPGKRIGNRYLVKGPDGWKLSERLSNKSEKELRNIFDQYVGK